MSAQADAARIIGQYADLERQVRGWQERGGFFRPFGQFEPRSGKHVTETRIFPFSRVAEAIEIEVRNLQAIRRFVRLHHGVSGALDAARHAKRPQQMANESRFTCTQIAMQFHVGVTQPGQCSHAASKGGGLVFAVPYQFHVGRMFLNSWISYDFSYNHQVTRQGSQINPLEMLAQIRAWAGELGFSQIGVADIDLASAEPGLQAWLDAGFHGRMDYMAAHGLKRARPAELVPGTVSVITARMDYLPRATPEGWQSVEFARLQRPEEGIVSVYARGRDYHKVLRSRLQKLQAHIAEALGPFGYRVFTDSAPVLEAELAARSGQGWRGKHTLVLSREAGSMFFLGEIYVDLALPPTDPVTGHCGSCQACLDVCPTQAIVAPKRLDARRCISYLTIEHPGAIDEALRPLLGNRIYGCDDCQLICPWNKYAQRSKLPDFDARDGLAGESLAQLFMWSEQDFLKRTEGGPIRRIGHVRWLRNIAVALGNALATLPAADPRREPLRAVLAARAEHPEPLVREHVRWALER